MAKAAAAHTSQAHTSQTGSESRELILTAALRAFAEHGFDGATTRDIAARAGVNHGLIPYYFGGKLQLWQAAVDRAFERLAAGLDAVLNDPGLADDRERAGLLIRNHVRFVARNPEFVLMMHDEGKRRGPRMRWLVDRHVRPLYEAIGVFLERARERGVIDPELELVHFHYILAGSVGLFFHQAEECKRLSGRDPFDPAMVEAHARAVERLLLGPAPAREETPR